MQLGQTRIKCGDDGAAVMPVDLPAGTQFHDLSVWMIITVIITVFVERKPLIVSALVVIIPQLFVVVHPTHVQYQVAAIFQRRGLRVR